MPPIRILVVDGYALFRDGIRALLEREEDLAWVGEAGDAGVAVQLALELKPDVVLMALILAGGDATRAIQEIATVLPETRIIALTSAADDDSIGAAIQAGVTGYVLKHASAAELIQAIRVVAAGGVIIDPRIAPQTIARFRQMYAQTNSGSIGSLTQRELEVLRLLCSGRSNEQIAAALHLSQQTIKNAVSGLYQKLGVHRRAEAIVVAMRLGLIPWRP